MDLGVVCPDWFFSILRKRQISMSEQKISVVVPTRNRANLLKRCLKSLKDQDYQNFEVIVIDDGSKDETKKITKQFEKELDLKYLFQENKGPTAARNLGIKKAKGGIVAFIDDDCLASEKWLKMINKALVKVEGVEGETVSDNGVTPFSHYIKNIKGSQYPTCNIAYRKEALEKVGGLDEKFPIPFREDSDLAFSILERGGKIEFACEALVNHPPFEESWLKALVKKRNFFYDPLLFKKHPQMYKKYLKFPFEMFTPFYILFFVLGFVNPLFFLGLPIAALIELLYRGWKVSLLEFFSFLALQIIGSFVLLISFISGSWKFKVNPLRFFVAR